MNYQSESPEKIPRDRDEAITDRAAANPDPKSGKASSSKEAPKDGEGLLKTTKESSYRKVAKFLVLIGKDEAAKILARLDTDQVEAITREIAGIQRIQNDEAEHLLAEFRDLLASGLWKTAGARGGVDTARDMLKAAFGAEAGESILKKTVPEGGLKPFEFLEEFEGEQIALMLAGESPSTMALILSRTSPRCAAGAIRHLDASVRTEVLKRIATMGHSSPEILDRVAAALREKAAAIGRQGSESLDGKFALAEILKRAEYGLGERLLEELSASDASLADDIRKRLYTLDDVLRANDRPLQEYLRGLDNHALVLLLKGKKPELVEKLLSNLSKSRRALVEDELSIVGPLPRHDVEEAASRFLSWFRNARDEGKIILDEDREDYV